MSQLHEHSEQLNNQLTGPTAGASALILFGNERFDAADQTASEVVDG
jgi:hypothetical protein